MARTVVLDYGHNPSSLACLIETLKQLPHLRRCGVYSAAGDRRDGDLIRQGELLGDAFDRVILYEEEGCIRGRKDGEIIALFRRGLSGRRRVKKIEEVHGAVEGGRGGAGVGPPRVSCSSSRWTRWIRRLSLVRIYLSSSTAREIDLRDALSTGRPDKVIVSHS